MGGGTVGKSENLEWAGGKLGGLVVGEFEEKTEYGLEKRVLGGGEIEEKTEYGLKKRVLRRGEIEEKTESQQKKHAFVRGLRFRNRQKLDRRAVFWGVALLENPRTSNVREANSEGWWWVRLRERQHMDWKVVCL